MSVPDDLFGAAVAYRAEGNCLLEPVGVLDNVYGAVFFFLGPVDQLGTPDPVFEIVLHPFFAEVSAVHEIGFALPVPLHPNTFGVMDVLVGNLAAAGTDNRN